MTASLSRPYEASAIDVTDISTFFSPREKLVLRSMEAREQTEFGTAGESCKTNLFFGFFLDGTKNNYIQAEAGKNHSCVARLYDCYPGLSVPGVLPPGVDWKTNADRYTHFFKVYVPGVASPFAQVNDTGLGKQLTLGAAMGALGEDRIVWTLIQAINNVHRYFLKQPLVTQPELNKLYRSVNLNKVTLMSMDDSDQPTEPGDDSRQVPRREFSAILRRLHAAIKPHWVDPVTLKPGKTDPAIVKTIYVSVFGFSRGATQARAFLNWLQALCRLDAQLTGQSGMTLGGFPVKFDFLGLFDTVASVGFGNTLGNTLVGKMFDGHGAWADAEVSLRVPPDVTCLHLVAAHELRRSFPVDSISVGGVLSGNCKEVVVPGVHSDIGCGYSPTEQGRGTDPNGNDMLARVPLLLMYRAARVAGVPLKAELASDIARERMAIAPETIAAFNAYIAMCEKKEGPIHHIMREQARKQIEWRVARRVSGNAPIQETASFKRASVFDQNDLHSAYLEFEEEIDNFLNWRKERKKGFTPQIQKPGFSNDHEAEWEEIATWWDSDVRPSDAVLTFFDNYVHDSRAWFKLIPGNPDNEADTHALLAKWVKERKAHLMHKQSAKRAGADEDGDAADGADIETGRHRREVHDPETLAQQAAAEEYEKTGKIPRYRTRGREPFHANSATYFLGGRAGYLRFRKIYGGRDAVLLSQVPGEPLDPAAVRAAILFQNTLVTG